MNRTEVVKKLNNRGFNAQERDVVKNGVVLKGIMVQPEENTGICISPIIYMDTVEELENRGLKEDEIISYLIKLYEDNKKFEFNVDTLNDGNFVLKNIFVGLQKTSSENIVKKETEFDEIESYMYINLIKNGQDSATTKVTAELLENAGISEDEAWIAAKENTYADTIIVSLLKVMCLNVNMSYFEEMEDMPIYILTNKSKIKGASAILNRKVLKELADKYCTDKIIAMPSSIHEFLVIPYKEQYDIDKLSEMVKEVNLIEFNPIEQLADKAYLITV